MSAPRTAALFFNWFTPSLGPMYGGCDVTAPSILQPTTSAGLDVILMLSASGLVVTHPAMAIAAASINVFMAGILSLPPIQSAAASTVLLIHSDTFCPFALAAFSTRRSNSGLNRTGTMCAFAWPFGIFGRPIFLAFGLFKASQLLHDGGLHRLPC